MLGYILLSVLLVSLMSLIGIFFVSMNEKKLNKILMILISFASGTMLGGAFLHLMPEAVSSGIGGVWIYILSGILGFFVLEKFLHWRHCHEGKCEIHSFAYINLIGDSVHNFLDGFLISAAYLVNFQTGIAATVAVLFHEIPQEIGDFGVLVYGGFKKAKALMYNFLTALTAVAGALAGYFLKDLINISYIIPIAAGGFIYIAGSDLIPELKKTIKPSKAAIEFLFIVAGVALMILMKAFLE